MDTETKEVIARAELPKLFRAIRTALGLSQEEMGKLSGISRVQISYYETAASVPTMATFNKWLEAATKEIKELRKNLEASGFLEKLMAGSEVILKEER
jgi:transcriptional regulator with XRE-family HTH domain